MLARVGTAAAICANLFVVALLAVARVGFEENTFAILYAFAPLHALVYVFAFFAFTKRDLSEFGITTRTFGSERGQSRRTMLLTVAGFVVGGVNYFGFSCNKLPLIFHMFLSLFYAYCYLLAQSKT